MLGTGVTLRFEGQGEAGVSNTLFDFVLPLTAKDWVGAVVCGKGSHIVRRDGYLGCGVWLVGRNMQLRVLI